jgi:hypothetical protein
MFRQPARPVTVGDQVQVPLDGRQLFRATPHQAVMS